MIMSYSNVVFGYHSLTVSGLPRGTGFAFPEKELRNKDKGEGLFAFAVLSF